MVPKPVLALIAVALTAGPAGAHHGWGSYDASKVLVFESKIVDTNYSFPHGEASIEVEAPNKKKWRLILAPPSRMENRGLTREMLVPGKVIKVEGYPSKVHDDEMRIERVTIDGRVIEMR
jgi:hypothetical protein